MQWRKGRGRGAGAWLDGTRQGGGRGGGGWKNTPDICLGRNGPDRFAWIFRVGCGGAGRLLAEQHAAPHPFATAEQQNGWRAPVGALFRCSAVSGEWHPLPLLQPRNYATSGQAVPGGGAVALLHGCRGYWSNPEAVRRSRPDWWLRSCSGGVLPASTSPSSQPTKLQFRFSAGRSIGRAAHPLPATAKKRRYVDLTQLAHPTIAGVDIVRVHEQAVCRA